MLLQSVSTVIDDRGKSESCGAWHANAPGHHAENANLKDVPTSAGVNRLKRYEYFEVACRARARAQDMANLQ